MATHTQHAVQGKVHRHHGRMKRKEAKGNSRSAPTREMTRNCIYSPPSTTPFNNPCRFSFIFFRVHVVWLIDWNHQDIICNLRGINRYLSLLPAVRLDDANTRVMCKHPKYPKSQFLNLSWVYAQLHYIQAHLEPHHNCWWSSIFPPCLLVF